MDVGPVHFHLHISTYYFQLVATTVVPKGSSTTWNLLQVEPSAKWNNRQVLLSVYATSKRLEKILWSFDFIQKFFASSSLRCSEKKSPLFRYSPFMGVVGEFFAKQQNFEG